VKLIEIYEIITFSHNLYSVSLN